IISSKPGKDVIHLRKQESLPISRNGVRMGVPTGMGAIEKSCLKQNLRVGVLTDLGSANAKVDSHHPSDRHKTHEIELLSIAPPTRKHSTVNGDLNESGS